MQAPEARKGVSTKSLLFDSLKLYLNNKNRLQPIIGLGSIVECVKAGTCNREALYLCEVCVCRLSKADVRNHIMGSFHRYNYIKAKYPHLASEWNEDPDLSKLAWPLMEKAKLIERKEGPGDVQLLEVEDAVYQMMTTRSENDAITLISTFRDGLAENKDHPDECHPVQSHRIVLLAQKQQSKISLKSSAHAGLNSAVASFVESERRSNYMSTSPSMSPDSSPLSEESSSFFDGYTGTKPLIGLSRVLECRSEDGHTFCFLCHCCRIRCNIKDTIDHLTSSCHILNYLMETHREQVEVMMAYIEDNYQRLLSLARKVEQQEGRGEMKVVHAPESLCILLTSKSYHWCLRKLCDGRTQTNTYKGKEAVEGPSVHQTLNQDIPEKCTTVPTEWGKGTTAKRKRGKGRNTVFKVSLPLSEGALLLKRASFSKDRLPMSPPAISDCTPSPECQSDNCDLDFDSGSSVVGGAEPTSLSPTSQHQQDLCNKDAGNGQYMGPKRSSASYYGSEEEVDGQFSDKEYFSHPEFRTGTKNIRIYLENNYNTQQVSQEGSSLRSYKKWQNGGPQTQNDWQLPSVSHAQDWSTYNSSYGPEESCTEQWHSSASQSNVCTSGDVSSGSSEEKQEMSSDAAQYYYQQQLQNQHMARDHAGHSTGSVGPHGWCGEYSSYPNAAWINMYPLSQYSHAHHSNIAQEPGEQLPQTEQRQWQTYMELPYGAAPQSYMTQPAAHQATQAAHGVTSDKYYTASVTSPDQHSPHPSVSGSTHWF